MERQTFDECVYIFDTQWMQRGVLCMEIQNVAYENNINSVADVDGCGFR